MMPSRSASRRSCSRALKYVDDWSRWMVWDSRVWKRDNTLKVYDLIRRTIRAIGPESADDRGARQTGRGDRTVAAIEKLHPFRPPPRADRG